jgi:hypothetical protein
MALAVQIGSGVDRWGPSRETLNLAHMIGLPNRTIEQISRSWSFLKSGSHRGMTLPEKQKVLGWARDARMVDIGNVNNQV